jgi:hypothetical protein
MKREREAAVVNLSVSFEADGVGRAAVDQAVTMRLCVPAAR